MRPPPMAGTAGPPPAIACAGVAFSYPDGTAALRDLDLTIAAGERVAIVGGNGSGRSTLVQLWNGRLRPTAGLVTVAGVATAGRTVAELAAVVGVALREPAAQVHARTVRDEVASGPRNLGIQGAGLAVAIDEALASVGLSAEADAGPHDLGPARRGLLAIASVLAMRTPVLVLDDPTVGQDGRAVGAIRAIVDRVAAEGRTVIVSSRDLRFVAESFSRVVVLGEGRVVLDGRPEEVFTTAAAETLAATGLDMPFAAVVGAALGFPPTPTEEALVAQLAVRLRDAEPRAFGPSGRSTVDRGGG